MTIHADFWRERHASRLTFLAGEKRLDDRRDAQRSRCYAWEHKHLRPVSHTFDRQGAKGYARLCVKIAIRRMRETGLIADDATAEKVRASFSAAFTKEHLGKCDANAYGAYFAAWGWTDVIIAHEVAHWADQWAHHLEMKRTIRSVPYVAHGARWRGWFAYLVGTAGFKTMPGLLDPVGFVVRSLAEEGLSATLP